MFAALRRFADRPAAALPCDLCGADLAATHEHVLDAQRRELRCACAGCSRLLSAHGGSRWLRVPSLVEPLAGSGLSEAQWNSLAIPVDVAFFYRHGQTGELRAVYPSPAGGTEATLAGSAWESIFGETSGLSALVPDIEALLVSRLDGAREHYRVSIDLGYALTGLIRRHWRGFSGGPEAWSAIGAFFAALRKGQVPDHA